MLIGCAICLSAGLWQWGRAAEKRALFTAFDRPDAKALTRPMTADEVDSALFRKIRLTGKYISDRQVLLDNMTFAGRTGYQVLTPLRTDSGVVLVNRGWIPAGSDRGVLPAIDVQDKMRTVNGRVNRLPRAGFELDAIPIEPDTAWPRRLTFPSVAVLTEQLGMPVQDYQILLEPTEADGYTREWRPALMPPEKHVAYAVQWFLMAATIMIIYFVLTIRAARRTKTHGKQ